MKLAYLFVLLVSVGASGQAAATTHTLLVGNNRCDETLTYGNSSKTIREIFPEECPRPLSDICTGNCMTGVLEAAPKPAQPEDVPAIKGEAAHWGLTNRECDLGETSTAGPHACPQSKWIEDTWTCKQKSRILLTAEDGKKWCHKPQTAGK